MTNKGKLALVYCMGWTILTVTTAVMQPLWLVPLLGGQAFLVLAGVHLEQAH